MKYGIKMSANSENDVKKQKSEQPVNISTIELNVVPLLTMEEQLDLFAEIITDLYIDVVYEENKQERSGNRVRENNDKASRKSYKKARW